MDTDFTLFSRERFDRISQELDSLKDIAGIQQRKIVRLEIKIGQLEDRNEVLMKTSRKIRSYKAGLVKLNKEFPI